MTDRSLILVLVLCGLTLYFGALLCSPHARARLRWICRVPDDGSGMRAFLTAGGVYLVYLVVMAVALAIFLGALVSLELWMHGEG